MVMLNTYIIVVRVIFNSWFLDLFMRMGENHSIKFQKLLSLLYIRPGTLYRVKGEGLQQEVM